MFINDNYYKMNSCIFGQLDRQIKSYKGINVVFKLVVKFMGYLFWILVQELILELLGDMSIVWGGMIDFV